MMTCHPDWKLLSLWPTRESCDEICLDYGKTFLSQGMLWRLAVTIALKLRWQIAAVRVAGDNSAPQAAFITTASKAQNSHNACLIHTAAPLQVGEINKIPHADRNSTLCHTLWNISVLDIIERYRDWTQMQNYL